MRIAKTIMKKKEQRWKKHTTQINVYYKATVIMTAWYWKSKTPKSKKQIRESRNKPK